jgi:hypothetical protein
MASKNAAHSKEQYLLPQHMGGCPEKSTATVPNMLVKQLHAAWQADNGVASLLSPDMTGAFNRVVHVRLHNTLRKQ